MSYPFKDICYHDKPQVTGILIYLASSPSLLFALRREVREALSRVRESYSQHFQPTSSPRSAMSLGQT